MKVLYWAGPTQEGGAAAIQQLSRHAPGLEIATVSNASDARSLINAVGGFDVLLISPTLSHQETLSVVATLRKLDAPGSIVPVVIQAQPDLITSAVAAGADDVLLLGGTSMHLLETLRRLSPRPRPAGEELGPGEGLGADAGGRIEPPVENLETTDGGANMDQGPAIARQWAEAYLARAHEDLAADFTGERELEDGAPKQPVTAGAGAADRVDEEIDQERANERARFETTGRDLESGPDAQYFAARQASVATAHAALEQARRHDAAERRIWDEARRRFESEVAVHRERFAATRRDLESFLTEAETVKAEHSTLRAELVAVREVMLQANADYAAERKVWDKACQRFESELAAAQERFEATLRDLESRLEKAEARNADSSALRAELAMVRGVLEQANENYATARGIWDEARERYDRDQAAERARFDATRRDLDTFLNEARAISDRRSQAEADLERGKADLAQVTATYDAERTAWETKREQLEQRIREAELISAESKRTLAGERDRVAARHDRLAACAPFPYAVLTLDGRLVRCSDHFARMFGYADSGDALGRTARGPFPPMTGRPELDARLVAEGQLTQIESYFTRVDGGVIHAVESAMVVSGAPNDEPVVERMFVDVSTRSEVEEQLRQARRLEEVGKLAIAVAAKVEALMSSIHAYATEWSTAEPQDPYREPAEMISELSTRAGALLRQLLTFTRKQVRQPTRVDLNEGVRRAEFMLTRLVGSHIEFTLQLGTARMITLDEHDLQQILSALVMSASDRLPVGGRLVLETGSVSREPVALGHVGETGGPKLVVAVTASGYGVEAVQPTETLESVVRRCGGTLEVDNDPGQRTTVRVYLPDCTQATQSVVDLHREAQPST